ncbi:hypothetical protein SB748_29000 [Rhizobium sp. SIMBA_035]
MLSVPTPGVLGPRYFQELADLMAGGRPDPAKVKALMDRYGVIGSTDHLPDQPLVPGLRIIP